MVELPQKLNEEIDKLRTLRDELRVKIDLGSKDARDLFEAAEKRWTKLEARLRVVGRESGRDAHEIGETLRMLAAEVRDSYHHVRDLLKAR